MKSPEDLPSALDAQLVWPSDEFAPRDNGADQRRSGDSDPPGSHTREHATKGQTSLVTAVLERLSFLGHDVEAELASLRLEMATLRHAVDDVAARVELRQLRGGLEELRGDVQGLRRAVLEWPELEQVGDDLAGLRADLAMLLERSVTGNDLRNAVSSQAATLRRELDQVREDLARQKPPPVDRHALADALDPLVEALAQVRGEVIRHIAKLGDELVETGQDRSLEEARRAGVLESLLREVSMLRAEVEPLVKQPLRLRSRANRPLSAKRS